MFTEERHSLIKRIVREKKRMNFAELQTAVKVSPATLRRDLVELEKSGDVIRVHGGVLHPRNVANTWFTHLGHDMVYTSGLGTIWQ